MPKAPKGYYTILDFMTMNDFQRTQALQEFRNLIEASPGAFMEFAEDPVSTTKEVKSKVKRKKSAYSRALSSELRKANKAARTKSGRLRKGMTPEKILKKAHKAVKRRLK